jgi:hypothetical protein
VDVVFPTALLPPAPPLANISDEGALLSLSQESPPATEIPVTEEVFEEHVPTLA